MLSKISLSLAIFSLSEQFVPLLAQLPRVDNIPEYPCQEAILSRLENYVIKPGDTIESIASSYGLLPETLIRLNSLNEQNPLSVGQTIMIPPFNGIRLEVPDGVTWKELAKAYGIRQDVLFELNGCVKIPKVVFIPGIAWSSTEETPQDYQGLSVYPLSISSSVGLGYGWHNLPNSEERLFHSGVDLLASTGTPVLAAEDGQVVFVGQEENYGFLLVINHAGGKQTRYAHLSRIEVQIGSEVKAGEKIAEVGTTGKPDLDAPHLHFEVRLRTPQGWIAQDPELHLPQ